MWKLLDFEQFRDLTSGGGSALAGQRVSIEAELAVIQAAVPAPRHPADTHLLHIL